MAATNTNRATVHCYPLEMVFEENCVAIESQSIKTSLFPTDLGWMALVWSGERVVRLTFGHPSAAAAVAHLDQSADWTATDRADLPAWAARGPMATWPRPPVRPAPREPWAASWPKTACQSSSPATASSQPARLAASPPPTA